MLEPGGVLRVVVPDLRAVVLEYMSGNSMDGAFSRDEKTSADIMNLRLCFREPESPSGNVFFRIYTSLKDFHTHKWMYDTISLKMYVEWAGFVNVCEKEFLQSQIEGIEKIEKAGRVVNGAGVCVEGVK